MEKYDKRLVEGCGKLSQKELSHLDNFGPSLNVFHLAPVKFRPKNAKNDKNYQNLADFYLFSPLAAVVASKSPFHHVAHYILTYLNTKMTQNDLPMH